MRLGRGIWVLLAVALVGFPHRTAVARASDHLEPEESTLGDGEDSLRAYDNIVATVLKDAYARDVVARVIVVPSFTAEYAVGITSDNARYSIFTLAPNVHLWAYSILDDLEGCRERVLKGSKEVCDEAEISELRARLPHDWHDVKVRRCEIDVDVGLGKRIVDVWRRVLAETRYDKADEGMVRLDGTTYHFAAFGHSGKTWSPSDSNAPGKLVNIADTMGAYCASRKHEVLTQLSADVGSLLSDLETSSRD